MHEPGIDQLIDQLLAEAFDVHRAAAREMQQRLLALRGTEEAACAARDRFVGETRDCRPAFGALRRHHERLRIARTLFRHDADDFGDHVAGTAHDHGIADVDILAPDLILVVQRRVGHRDAADEHGREPRDGRDRTGAPDLDVDPEHLGRHLFRRELVRHGPARFARDEPERALRGERVDLVDDAVDVERQAAAPLGDALVERDEVGGAAGDAPIAIHRQPGALEEVEQLRVSGGQREPLRLARCRTQKSAAVAAPSSPDRAGAPPPRRCCAD